MLKFNISVGSPFWDPILKVLDNVQFYTVSAVVFTVIGAAIMQHPHPGFYNVLWSSRIGAVGGSILAIPIMLVTILIETVFPKDMEMTFIEAWVNALTNWTVGAASSIGAAALGAKILAASLGMDTVKQGIRESAIAGGVGAAVVLAAMLAIFFAFCIFTQGVVAAMVIVWMSVKSGRMEPEVAYSRRTTVTRIPMQNVVAPTPMQNV